MYSFVRETQSLVQKASWKTQSLKIVLISQIQNYVRSPIQSITRN